MDRITQAIAGAEGEQDARARLGAVARQVPVIGDEPELVTTMRERFGADAAWPEGELAVCTIDATDGEFRVLTAASGVPLHVAVAASCSVPLVWPTVEVDGRADHGRRHALGHQRRRRRRRRARARALVRARAGAVAARARPCPASSPPAWAPAGPAS